ncbi:MAG: hypothetical protein ACXIUL_07360 [Wenzhouxiangella sp.]
MPVGPADGQRPAVMDTLERASQHGIRCLVSGIDGFDLPIRHSIEAVKGSAGRGRQMNRAAALAASDDWLWFLHADSRCEPEVLSSALALAAQSTACLGWFSLAFDSDGPALTRLNAMGANLRSRWLGLPYGDQGLILPKPWFDRLGGFREDLERGEDLDLVVRAKRAGLTLRGLAGRITTSARRYADQGWLATTLKHQRAAWRLVRDARRQ